MMMKFCTNKLTLSRHALASVFVLSMLALSLSGCGSMRASAGNSLTETQIATLIASPDRSEADRTNDLRRKPGQMLAFIGIRPGLIALDLSAGGGYTTELLARAVGPTGRVYGQSQPPRAIDAPPRPAVTPEGNASPPSPSTQAAPTPPRRTSAQALAERAKNPALSNLFSVVRAFEDPVPPEAGRRVCHRRPCGSSRHGNLRVRNAAPDRGGLFAKGSRIGRIQTCRAWRFSA